MAALDFWSDGLEKKEGTVD